MNLLDSFSGGVVFFGAFSAISSTFKDSDQDSLADGTLGDESGTDTECVEKPTRRRSRSDYNAEVFENMQELIEALFRVYCSLV